MSRKEIFDILLLLVTVSIAMCVYDAESVSADPVDSTYVGGGISYALDDTGGLTTAVASWDGSSTIVVIEPSVVVSGQTYMVSGVNSFSGNTTVTKVTINTSDVMVLPDGIFSSVTSLTEIVVAGSIESLPNSFCNSASSLSSVDLTGCTNLKSIGSNAFAYTSITDITLPSTVTSIGESAFSTCKSLKNVTLPGGITTIPTSAFMSCESLETASMGEITNFGKSAFKGCKVLKSVDVSYATVIGAEAFSNCNAIENVSLNDNLTDIGSKAFYGCTNLKTANLPGKTVTMEGNIFQSCKSLVQVTLSEDLKKIQSGTFQSCISLERINLENVEAININAFNGCYALDNVVLTNVVSIGDTAFNGCKSLKSITFGDRLETITGRAFVGCAFTEVHLPASATKISWFGSTSLTFPVTLKTITISSDNPKYVVREGVVYEMDSEGALIKAHYCPTQSTGERIVYADVAKYAFQGCNLSKITIADGVKIIDEGAFAACLNLKELVIADSVETIGNMAIGSTTNQYALKAITLPANLSSLGTNVFRQLKSLQYVEFPDGSFTTPKGASFAGFYAYVEGSGYSELPKSTAGQEYSSASGMRFVWNGTDAGKYYQITSDQVLLTTVVNGDVTYGAIAKGSPFAAPTAPEAPAGLSFVGWFTDSAMTVGHDENTAVTADLTLYAKYRIDTCTVNLMVDDSVKDSMSGLAPGNVITLPAVSKDGQNFNGWVIDGTLLGAQYIVSVNDANEVGIITLEALFSPIEKSSWNLTVTGDVNGKAFWTTTNAIGTYGMITVLPDEFETVTYTVSSNGGYGIISDNCAMVYSIDGNDVTVTVAFQDVGKASEYDVSVAEIASGEKHGLKATVIAKGGYVDSDGEFAISYVYKTWNDADKVWIYTTSGVTENVSNVLVTIPTDKKVSSVTGEFLLDNADAILVFGFATFSFKGTSVTGTAEDVTVHSPVIMCVSEIQAVVGKP